MHQFGQVALIFGLIHNSVLYDPVNTDTLLIPINTHTLYIQCTITSVINTSIEVISFCCHRKVHAGFTVNCGLIFQVQRTHNYPSILGNVISIKCLFFEVSKILVSVWCPHFRGQIVHDVGLNGFIKSSFVGLKWNLTNYYHKRPSIKYI